MEETNKVENVNEQQRSHLSSQATPGNIVLVNFQMIIWMDIANETPKKYSEFLENMTNFNLSSMKTVWKPILYQSFLSDTK